MLLIGPPGSGKTHFVLEALETAVRQDRAAEAKLIVPARDMARHLLHTLARRGLVVPGNLVETIDDVVNRAAPDARQISRVMEAYLLKEAVRQVAPPAFSGLESSPGLRRKIARAMQEFWAAGADNLQLDGPARNERQRAFANVFRRFEEMLAETGLVHRNQRIAQAAAVLRREGLGPVKRVWLDGFDRFSKQEQAFVEALAEQSEAIAITMPDGLAPYPFPQMEKRFFAEVYRPAPEPEIVAAASPRGEVLEVARRILDDGRPWRQFGVVLRSPQMYAPLIDEVFGALRIPFRMRSQRKLADHGAAGYLRRWLTAAADGFPAEAVLELLCSPLSPVGGFTDAYDFAVRRKLPGGLDLLRAEARERAPILDLLDRVAPFSERMRETRSGRQWAQTARQLRGVVLKRAKPVPEMDPGRLAALKERAQAEAGFDAALDAAAELGLGAADEPMPFADFLERLDEALAAAPLTVRDDRKEVVQVLSAHEARQWTLPVVFVCGLVEDRFPRKHRQEVFFPDADRERLAARGIALRTSAEIAADEKFLYRMARTRATEKLTLIYPCADEDGSPLLRSFFLDSADDAPAPAARVSSPLIGRSPAPAALQAQDHAAVAERHVRGSPSGLEQFSPSGLETFLQCPYRFFAQKTLKLNGRPEASQFRLGAQTSGSIIHKTIHHWSLEGGSIVEILDRVFADALADAHLKLGFRAALIRGNMRADLERFAREAKDFVAKGQAEAKVEYTLDGVEPPAEIVGRVDHYRIDGEEQCFLVDYKYASAHRVKSLRKEYLTGEQLQLPLYMLGLLREHQAQPGGMALCGLRGSTRYEGWSVSPEEYPGDSIIPKAPPKLQGQIDAVRLRAAELISAVRGGEIAVKPRDKGVCKRFCEYKPVCRIAWDSPQEDEENTDETGAVQDAKTEDVP